MLIGVTTFALKQFSLRGDESLTMGVGTLDSMIFWFACLATKMTSFSSVHWSFYWCSAYIHLHLEVGHRLWMDLKILNAWNSFFIFIFWSLYYCIMVNRCMLFKYPIFATAWMVQRHRHLSITGVTWSIPPFSPLRLHSRASKALKKKTYLLLVLILVWVA